MRLLGICIVVSVLLASCAQKEMDPQKDKQFDAYKERFVEAYWTIYPGYASTVGYHKYDSVLIVPDAAAREHELNFCKAQLDSLNAYKPDELSDNNRTDYLIIKNQLEGSIWSINEFRSWEWNPSQYNVSETFAEMLNGTYDSLDNRLRNVYRKMAAVPAYYRAAVANIKNPTKEHTELAIEQNTGGVSVFEVDLVDALAKSRLPEEEKRQISERAVAAATAMKDYAKWLQELKNDNPGNFRIGGELYRQKFKYDIQSGYTAEQIYEKALERKQELHDNMYELADTLWGRYMGKADRPTSKLQLIKDVIDKISIMHTTPEKFQASIEQQIPVLVKFINEKNLIYLDPEKPLVVRKEPAYMAGVAGASITAPRPYDKGGNTYYNVGSLAGWEPERAESYLREYNHYTLQILNIHEAIPGHYTQLIYSNQSPSIIKAIFGNGTMIEGWAVYTELMMLENGYGNNEAEMWLMYYKWNLRSTCNAILDYNVHVKNMSKEDAMDLLTKEAFQQNAEAEGKWRRATLTQVQLCSYFTGFTEICDLRAEVMERQGEKFDLRKFHEKFLSYGSAPVKYIKEMMLEEL